MTVFHETKIAIIVGPEAKPATALEGTVGAPAGLDPSELRRTLLHTGCPVHDRVGTHPAGHHHNDVRVGPAALTPSSAAPRHAYHSNEIPNAQPGAAEQDSSNSQGARSRTRNEIAAREGKENSKDRINRKESPIRGDSADSTLEKTEDSRERRGAPRSPTEQDTKLGIERRAEPMMPDRSTPIGDLLKPDTLREMIGTRISSPNTPNALMSDALSSRHTPNRSHEHHQGQDQRSETQKLVQQVQIQETLAARPVAPDASTSDGRTPTPSALTAATLNDLRRSTLDTLHQMKSALEIAIERANPHLAAEYTQPAHGHSQAPGAFNYVEPIRHNQAPVVIVQTEDRSHPGRNDASARSEKANIIFDGLAAIAKNVVNIDTLRKLDQSFETASLAMFAAAALGVIATDRLLRELLALARETEQRLKEEDELTHTERDTIERLNEAVRTLEEELAGAQASQAGLVADITGIVADTTLSRPLAGVCIDAGPLGTIKTNNWGEFHLRNIPIGTAYRLIPSHFGYSFAQDAISGTVGTTNYIHIDAIRQPCLSDEQLP